jgi:aromatic ring hydroxylase
LDSLKRPLWHRVLKQGEDLEKVADHPISSPPATAMSKTYYQAEKDNGKSLFAFNCSILSPYEVVESLTCWSVWKTGMFMTHLAGGQK